MNKICRDQFVALHSLPLLEELSAYFVKNFGFTEDEMRLERDRAIIESMRSFNQVLQNVPDKGSFNLDQVKDSVYFFS